MNNSLEFNEQHPPNIKDFVSMLEEARAKSKERLAERFKEIPKIHWEILTYSNNHSKQEVIQMYPEHIDFIETIIGLK
jgi:hypothetical protein